MKEISSLDFRSNDFNRSIKFAITFLSELFVLKREFEILLSHKSFQGWFESTSGAI